MFDTVEDVQKRLLEQGYIAGKNIGMVVYLAAKLQKPVLVEFELPTNSEGKTRLKVGSQATVVVYTGTHPVFNTLGRLIMRLRSLLEYAY